MQRPETDGGLFCKPLKGEISSSCDGFSPHGGGRRCKMKCLCLHVTSSAKTLDSHVKSAGLDLILEGFVNHPLALFS